MRDLLSLMPPFLAVALSIGICPAVTSSAQPAQSSPNYQGIHPPPLPVLKPGQGVIRLPNYNFNDPVKIVSVQVDGKEVSSRQPFDISPDWIGSTDITVRNDTSKTLVNLYVQVDFPEFPGHFMEFDVGQRPASARHDRAGVLHELPATDAIAIAPGAVVHVSLRPLLKKFADALHDSGATPSNLHFMQVAIMTAYFGDGTRWQLGVPTPYAKPDPDNPGKWVLITKPEFGPINTDK